MKKEESSPHKFESLSELHRILNLPKPFHPLISLVDNMDNKFPYNNQLPNPFTMNFYKISYKPNLRGKFKYGQSFYDFDEGGLVFVSPNQLAANDDNNSDHSGYVLLIHPDFFLTYPLAKKINQYGFFSYSANEALHLSESEKETIISIFKIIEKELKLPIDDFSQDVIIAQLELLLAYSERFYRRQFITRKTVNNQILQRLEALLTEYFNNDVLLKKGLPTVEYISNKLNVFAKLLKYNADRINRTKHSAAYP